MIHAAVHLIVAVLGWVELACFLLVFGPLAGHLIHRVLTGPRPSAAEVARAQQMAATPAHPSLRHPGLPVDGRKLDDYEQRALDSIRRRFTWADESGADAPQQRRP